MNKRGQELSTSTIILIILGVIILVVLVLGFTIGWNKILPIINQSNVNTLQTQCLAACSTNSVYDFCSRNFDLNTGTTSLKNVTCNYLALKQPSYGINACSSVTCSNIAIIDNPYNGLQLTTGTGGTFNNQNSNICGNNAGKTVQALISGTLVSVQC